jgi:hypothetical protein
MKGVAYAVDQNGVCRIYATHCRIGPSSEGIYFWIHCGLQENQRTVGALMTARDRSKDLFTKGKQNAERIRAAVAKRTEKSETMQSAVEKIGTAGKWSFEKISDAQRLVENKIKQYMGFDKYRLELENSLEEALKVIAVQEERIKLLEIQQKSAQR